MQGKRKFYGYIIAITAIVVGLFVFTGEAVEIELAKTYFWTILVVSSGFFGFNGFEHWVDKGK
jgi:hypothetical protein